jgi:predicted TIM-barrel fold metal-dependent hydrolase
VKPGIQSAIVEELVETGTLRSFKVIDTHGHMGEWSAIHFPNPDPESMLRTMDRCGVEWLAFSHHEALQGLDEGNRKAQAAVAAHPDRYLGYWAVNPNYPDRLRKGVAEFDRLRGFAGYKILAGYYGTPITCAACKPLWEHAQERRLVVLLHTWSNDEFAGAKQVAEIAKAYPDVTILMGHSQYGAWDVAIGLAREFPNVYCELCAAHSAGGAIQKMVDAGIEDKITYGTDLPWFDPMYAIGCVVFTRTTDAVRRKILRGNAERIFARWIAKG